MQTIETIIRVTPDGEIIVPLKANLAPGDHRAVLVIEETTAVNSPQSLHDFPVHDLGPWPDDLSLRREDLYDERGR